MILEVANIFGIGTIIGIIMIGFVLFLVFKDHIEKNKKPESDNMIDSYGDIGNKLDDLSNNVKNLVITIDEISVMGDNINRLLGCIDINKSRLKEMSRDIMQIKHSIRDINGFEPEENRLGIFENREDAKVIDFIDRFNEMLDNRKK